MTTSSKTNMPEPAANPQQILKDLLALGKKNGRLSLAEIAEALSHLELDSEDIDKLYETFEAMGIEVEAEGVLEKMPDPDSDDGDELFEPGAVEEVTEEELVDTSAMAESC